MRIKKLKLERFKKVETAELLLDGVNVIVGGNNAGKSSVLQGIHFSLTAAIAARQQGVTTFSSDLLLYNPTPDFSVLRNAEPYLNHHGMGDSVLSIFADFQSEDGQAEESSYSIRLYKGRNHGNIGCEREGDFPKIGSMVTDQNKLFCVYVPGLAGIPQHEELRAKAIVRRGVASGDANLYLRNILYYIKQDNKLASLNERLSSVFADNSVEVEFDEVRDHRIQIYIRSGETRYPLELSGTGLLQALQIFSYITYFEPKLLLLDEPDSHLHPDNQSILCKAILKVSEGLGPQILLCTHSRHMVDALYEQANFIWMKDGRLQEQGQDIKKLPLLLDIGALDDFDKLRAGNIDVIVLTEDRIKEYLEFLLLQNGFQQERMLIYSYKTSSNLEGASLFVDFLHDVARDCKVIIHRDRDFMTTEEVQSVEHKIRNVNAIPFITVGSDIESYFTNSYHIAHLLWQNLEQISLWINSIAVEYHNDIQHQFTRKRDEIKSKLYRDNRDDCPETIALLGAAIPLSEDKRKGKFILKKIRGAMFARFGRQVDLKQPSAHLRCPVLVAIRAEIGLD